MPSTCAHKETSKIQSLGIHIVEAALDVEMAVSQTLEGTTYEHVYTAKKNPLGLLFHSSHAHESCQVQNIRLWFSRVVFPVYW